MTWALAVDGGNTKTLAVVAGADGEPRGRGRAGCADIHNADSPALALAEIEAAARAALAEAGAEPADVASAVFSLAGADWPEDFALLEGALRERLGLRVAPLVVNDALGALRAGSDDWTGIAVVSGTYNAIGARHPDGRVFHLGFWPDAAGGRQLATEGLRAVYRAELGMGPPTALTERALALWGASDAIALLYAFTRRGGLPAGEEDRLAPLVIDAADDGRSRGAGDRGRHRAGAGPPGPRLCGAPRAAARRDARGADGRRLRAPVGAARRRRDGRAAGSDTGPPRAAAGDRRAAAGARPPARGRRRPVGGISLERVSKVFPGGVVAVDDVDLAIGDGEFIVLVGPSGCGKSTLLRMIAGLEGVSGGTIRIGDREVTELAPRARDIAMVFQNYALYPHMRVWDNLAFALKLRRVPKPAMRERVGSVAGVLGLKELIDRKPGALSGGQRQRVAIGRAMVREPEAYLMDEPLSNLDAKLRVGMRAELARLHERLGTTTVYVTHDQVEAMTLGDRVAVLRDGTVQQCDTPERLFDEPANVFVAAFIGTPPMNLAPGEVRDGRVRFAGIEVPLDGAAARGEVIAGVRPTDLAVREGDGHPVLPAKLEVVERLGSESHVIFAVDAPRLTGAAAAAADEATAEDEATLLADDRRARFTAVVQGRRRFSPGDTVELTVRPETLHLFDPATGDALR